MFSIILFILTLLNFPYDLTTRLPPREDHERRLHPTKAAHGDITKTSTTLSGGSYSVATGEFRAIDSRLDMWLSPGKVVIHAWSGDGGVMCCIILLMGLPISFMIVFLAG